jgi:hypothetical protein
LAKRAWQILSLETDGDLAIAARLDTNCRPTHSGADLLAGDLEHLPLVANRIVIGDHTAVHLTQNRFQHMLRG